MKGCFTNSPIIQDEDFGGAAARTRDQGRRNPPESYRAKPKSKPQNATIENAARNRASAMKREFPQIKDIPDAISKSKRRALIAQWASTGSTPPIDTLSIHTNAGGNALSTRKDPTQRISAKRPDSRRTGGRGGASTSDPIEID